jgi:hypothetical protein
MEICNQNLHCLFWQWDFTNNQCLNWDKISLNTLKISSGPKLVPAGKGSSNKNYVLNIKTSDLTLYQTPVNINKSLPSPAEDITINLNKNSTKNNFKCGSPTSKLPGDNSSSLEFIEFLDPVKNMQELECKLIQLDIKNKPNFCRNFKYQTGHYSRTGSLAAGITLKGGDAKKYQFEDSSNVHFIQYERL